MKNNRKADTNRDDGGNIRNQQGQHAINIDQHLGIALVIPEFKVYVNMQSILKPDELKDWLVCVTKVYLHISK